MARKKIFIMDDDRDILESMKMILEHKGYEVETSFNTENIQSVHKKTPDLLLVDIWMSGVDGSDFCRELKENKDTSRIPIIIISANTNVKEISLKCKANGYIAKPFELQELITIVEKHTTEDLPIEIV